eukprot:TRINITY_DN44975_c0_g1_i1.p2 TRINITY_DN44975_c0_g1~~TRINITY_DN44975_c0_g1_i1.p2  ORF type:complete len:188 (+),score=43.81 TRINITY_DN44975_c0_g1_i1:83-646(+)
MRCAARLAAAAGRAPRLPAGCVAAGGNQLGVRRCSCPAPGAGGAAGAEGLQAQVLSAAGEGAVRVLLQHGGAPGSTAICECEPRLLMGGSVAGTMLLVVPAEGGAGAQWRAVQRLPRAAAARVAPKFGGGPAAAGGPAADGGDFAARVRRNWDWSSQQALRRVGGGRRKQAELLPWTAKADMMGRQR